MSLRKRQRTTKSEIEIVRVFARESGALERRYAIVNLVNGEMAVPLDTGPGGDFFEYDSHYTPSGHRKVAAAMVGWWLR